MTLGLLRLYPHIDCAPGVCLLPSAHEHAAAWCARASVVPDCQGTQLVDPACCCCGLHDRFNFTSSRAGKPSTAAAKKPATGRKRLASRQEEDDGQQESKEEDNGNKEQEAAASGVALATAARCTGCVCFSWPRCFMASDQVCTM